MKSILILKNLIFLVLLTLLSSCKKEILPGMEGTLCELPEAYTNHPKAVLFQEALDVFRKQNKIPGAILLISSEQYTWAGASGYADLEKRIPINACNQFRTASTTKTLIATLIMQQKEKGRLNLLDPLIKFLPDLKNKIPYAADITIQQLLQHTSGTNDYQENLAYRLDIFNNPGHTAALGSRELLQTYVYHKAAFFKPGTAWNYSNTDYLLLELVLNELEGKTTQQIMEERLFRPLAMNNSYYEPRDDRNVVRGYRDLYDNGNIVATRLWDRTDDGQGDGGLTSCATDLLQFSRALFGAQLLSEATLAEMQNTLADATNCPDFCQYGLGFQKWTIGQDKIGWGHAGTAYGSRAYKFYFPQEKTHFILFTNLGNSPDRVLMSNLINSVIP